MIPRTTSEITPAWLTEVLRQREALHKGHVSAIEADTEPSVTSEVAHLRVQYSPDAEGPCPSRLFLKICHAAQGGFSSSEVDYYQHDYATVATAPLPYCYAAEYSFQDQRYFILLEDCAETHEIIKHPQPTEQFARQLAEACAALHAPYWGATQLQAADYHLTNADDLDRYIGHLQQGLAPILQELAGQVPDLWLEILRDVFTYHPQLMLERLSNPTGWTLIHGDLNPTNILIPRDPHGRTLLIDRQPFDWSLKTWLGISDLTYAIVHWWSPEKQRELLGLAVDQYQQSLAQHGCTYERATLEYDLRLCAVQSLYIPVEWCVLPSDRTNMRDLWMWQLHNTMPTIIALGCGELWGKQYQ